MITDMDMRQQVAIACGAFADEFDLDAIVDELRGEFGLVHIDEIPSEQFWAVVEHHDTSDLVDGER